MKRRLDPHMTQIINSYYENGAKKLNRMVDMVLQRLRFQDIERTDYYSLADEIFVKEVLENYDEGKNFDGFLYSCLYKKFCSEMTRAKREKRCTRAKVKMFDEDGNEVVIIKVIPDICIDAPLNDTEDCTVGDMIPDRFDVHKEAFEEKEDGYSAKMIKYLNRLSHLQKEVLRLTVVGYMPHEIKEELHITDKQYEDCQSAIHSYKNISILF